jgi:prepilin-type N-terminal cleavage/methylation domain-containing protein
MRRSGFTLIELLIVVVIIGILASIAIPKFRVTKGKSYAAAMKSDLRNLAVAQEAYKYDNGTYANSLAQMSQTSTTGVVLIVSHGDAAGWGATATHPMADPLVCAFYVGPTPVAPATSEGMVMCN